MRPPVRLLSDPNLSAALRTDLMRARHAADDYDAASKVSALQAALAEVVVSPEGEAPLGEPSTLTHAATRSAWSPLHVAPWLGKVGLVVCLAGAGVGALSLVVKQPRPPAAVARTPTLSTPAAEPRAPTVTSTPSVEGAEATELALPSTPTAAAAFAAPQTGTAARSSRREIDQLVRIRALLTRDPARAYRLARSAALEFPRGALSEEREALEVRALAMSGERAQARRAFAAFVVRHPESPLRESLAAVLAR